MCLSMIFFAFILFGVIEILESLSCISNLLSLGNITFTAPIGFLIREGN